MENKINVSSVMEGEKTCTACGEKIKQAAEICPKCGVKQEIVAKSLLNTILLAYFLGGFGAHNFYINRTKKGIISVILCWTGIPAIFSLLDVMSLTKLNLEAANAKYSQKFIDCEKIVKTVFFILSIVSLVGFALSIVGGIIGGIAGALAS